MGHMLCRGSPGYRLKRDGFSVHFAHTAAFHGQAAYRMTPHGAAQSAHDRAAARTRRLRSAPCCGSAADR